MLGLEFDCNYAFEAVKEIVKEPRFTGTPGEERARLIIIGKLEEMGLSPFLEPFSVKTYTIQREELVVEEPRREEIPCSGVGFSGSTGEKGVSGRLVYVETGDRALLPEERGWVGLASSRPEREDWGFLAKRALGLVIAESSPHRELSTVDIPHEWLEEYGELPAVYVRYRDAYKLLKAERVRLTLIQKYREVTSYNIVAEIVGSKYPDEVIVITAHYDSERNAPGAVDNAGGTALALGLAKAMSKRKPKRTLRFVFTAAEELGLRGSLAYVDSHKNELRNIKVVVNLDVHGQAIGTNHAIVTGNPKIAAWLEVLAKTMGMKVKVREDVMSSDGTPFAREGIPVINFYRGGGPTVDMHSKLDDLRYVHPQAYKIIGSFALRVVLELAGAEEFPLPREVTEDMKKKVKEYFEKRGFGKKLRD